MLGVGNEEMLVQVGEEECSDFKRDEPKYRTVQATSPSLFKARSRPCC